MKIAGLGRMRRLALGMAVLTLLAMSSGCLQAPETDRIGVVVTLGPQREMVEAIGGERIRVTVMVPSGENPHTYAPVPAQMTDLARADIYFKVGSGVEFELSHLDEITSQNKALEVVDCSQGIPLLEAPGNAAGHEEGGKDPHIWLSPANAKLMVETMCEGLVAIDRSDREHYEKNRDNYLAKLDELDLEIRTLLQGRGGSAFLVYHPAFAYLAHAYNLTEMAIEDKGKEPSPARVAAIIREASERNIKVVFVSPQSDRSSAQTIAAEIGGQVVVIDPLAEDYIENLRNVAAELSRGLAG